MRRVKSSKKPFSLRHTKCRNFSADFTDSHHRLCLATTHNSISHLFEISNAKSRLVFNRSTHQKSLLLLSSIIFLTYTPVECFICSIYVMLLIMNQLRSQTLPCNMKSQQLFPLILNKCEFEYDEGNEWKFFAISISLSSLSFHPLVDAFLRIKKLLVYFGFGRWITKMKNSSTEWK